LGFAEYTRVTLDKDVLEKAILDSWDTKLWWPHSETLFTSILAFKLTGDNDGFSTLQFRK